MMTRAGYVSSPLPAAGRCGRWLGVCFTACLILFCYVSALVRAWIPAMMHVADPQPSKGSLALALLTFFGAVIGTISGLCAIISFVRVVFVHPGHVWFNVLPQSPDASRSGEVPMLRSAERREADPANGNLAAANVAAEDDSANAVAEDTPSLAGFSDAANSSGGNNNMMAVSTLNGMGSLSHRAVPVPPAAPPTAAGGGSTNARGQLVISAPQPPWALAPDQRVVRFCGKCDRPKPPFSHHCSRCGTCIDRMDHHCPWIGQCVGRGNLKYFLLFLLHVTITGVMIALTTGYNMIRFFRELSDADSGSPHHHYYSPQPFPPPPFTTSTPSTTSLLSTTPGPTHAPTPLPPADGGDDKTAPDLVLVVAWFIATLFALMLSCFFGAVWQATAEGETQLDRRPVGRSGRAVDLVPASDGTSFLRRFALGRGSALLWFIPTAPVFTEADVVTVPLTPSEVL